MYFLFISFTRWFRERLSRIVILYYMIRKKNFTLLKYDIKISQRRNSSSDLGNGIFWVDAGRAQSSNRSILFKCFPRGAK